MSFRACGTRSRLDGETMIEASPSRCTPEQWTAEQAARAMGVADEADGEGLGVAGAEVGEIGMAGEIGREEPNPRRGMRWVAGGAAIAMVAAVAWWSGAGNRDSREIPVHAEADVALIAGERTPNSASGDFNSNHGSSHMKIQTTAAAALLGAAAIAFQAQAGDAVQWRVEDGGNGHWYQHVGQDAPGQRICWNDARDQCRNVGGELVSLNKQEEEVFLLALCPTFSGWIGYQGTNYWSSGELVTFTHWGPAQPSGDGPYATASCPDGWWNDIGGSGGCWNGLASYTVEWSADCNNDNIVDFGQILNGTLPDTNTNGIPDCCEPGNNCCLGDIYVNHIVDGGDLGVLLSEWGAVTPTTQSDLNGDGLVDGADLGLLLANWGPCNP